MIAEYEPEVLSLWSRATRGLSDALSSLTGNRPLRDARNLPPVFVAATCWTVSGVNVFSANLVRGLNRLGGDARVLVTEQNTDLVRLHERPLPRAADIPFEPLGHTRGDSWGSHWGRMVRFLSERAPCVYVPNSDWRHSCVCPRLPDNVITVGILHSDDPLHYDHLRRIGHTWNAIVAVSRTVAEKAAELCPALADRITTIPIGARIPSERLERGSAAKLRLIYHGVLKQHQKRVLDLPRIVQAAADRGVPVELTIVGAGPDEEMLRSSAAMLVDRGLIEFYGVVAPDDIGALLAQHDVYLLASEFEGLPNALIEAMGQGCVPLVTQMKSGVPEVVRDGTNGFIVPIGDTDAFADRLSLLWSRPSLRRRLSKRAFRTASARRYRVEEMVASYAGVFDRARSDAVSRRFVRPMGELSLPPAELAGVRLFPLPITFHEPGIGSFPTEDDALDYKQEVIAHRNTIDDLSAEARIDGMRVYIACPVWLDTGVTLWAEDIARGLRGAGLDARLLLTEESTHLVQIPGRRLDRPDDIPCEYLPLEGPDDGWGARWGAMTRLLESNAPCFYLPHFDWRHSCVTPLLSANVMVVGVVHSNEATYFEHARRLGRSWNAVVATNREALSGLRREFPELIDRMSLIPHGVATQVDASSSQVGMTETAVVVIVDSSRIADFTQLVARLSQAGRRTVAVLMGDAIGAATLLLESGANTIVGPNRQEWIDLCGHAAVVVGLSPDGNVERMTAEAMARGSVAVLLARETGTAEFAPVDLRTGLPAPTTLDGVFEWVVRILSDKPLHASLVSKARAAAAEGQYTTGQTISSFVQLFRRIRRQVEDGHSPERWGRIEPPPAAVDGVEIFPVSLDYETPRGLFPSERDAQRFESEAALAIDAPVSEESVSKETATGQP
jgi:glycosyltransferase involved in cell wall biosynthesis